MKKPSDLDVGANYHLFKNGIKPMWEDKANAGGGKWQVRVKDRQSLDEFWQNLVLALVGETADENDEICGCVMSRRRGGMPFPPPLTFFLSLSLTVRCRRCRSAQVIDWLSGPEGRMREYERWV